MTCAQGGCWPGAYKISKTAFLPKGISQEGAFDAALSIITSTPALAALTRDISLASFVPQGFVGIGVQGFVGIGTDAFVQKFVAKTCRAIIDDVEKSGAIQDGFIHYQLLRFCQATRLNPTIY